MTEEKDNFFHYLPISQDNIRWGLYLTGVGFCRAAAGAAYPPPHHPDVYHFNWTAGRILPEYQIVLITDGGGTFESAATGPVSLSAGSAIFLLPGHWHRYRPDPKTGWTEYWLSWNGDYLYRLQRQGVLTPRHAVHQVREPGPVIAAFERIAAYSAARPAENAGVLSAYAVEILTLVLPHERAVQTDPSAQKTAIAEADHALDDPMVFHALQLIWNLGHRGLKVESIVRKLPVTRRTLERRFQRCLGRSIGQEIIRCRIERARHLLENTALPIKHIALAVGFTSADRLGKAFVRHIGLAPGDYRRRTQNPSSPSLVQRERDSLYCPVQFFSRP